jgi:flagellar biosynthesis protein FlhB
MTDNPDQDQKKHFPTEKRKADAARNGDVMVSKELASATMMATAAAWLYLAGGWFFGANLDLVKQGLALTAADHRNFAPMENAGQILMGISLPFASLLAVTLFSAIATPALIGGLGWRSSAMAFKGSRINPLSGLKRMFGAQGATELVKAVAKVLVLSAIGYWVLRNELPAIMGLAAVDIKIAVARAGQAIAGAFFALSLGLLVIAGIDVPAQFLQRRKRLMMTDQEIKDEMKQSEGSPEMKHARRARQHEMLSNSAHKAVSEAAVILTNPTHFAIALRYRPGIDLAPVVAARGRGEVAEAIKTLAKERGVPMLEYPQLTRAIYFTSRPGRTISEDLYIAVAAILAFVFQLDQTLAQRVSPPKIEVPTDKRFDEHGRTARG